MLSLERSQQFHNIPLRNEDYGKESLAWDLSSTPRTNVIKARCGGVIPGLGRGTPGAPWPASLAQQRITTQITMWFPLTCLTLTLPCVCTYSPQLQKISIASLLTGLGLNCFCLLGRTGHRRHRWELVYWEVVLRVEAMRNQFLQGRDLQVVGVGQ